HSQGGGATFTVTAAGSDIVLDSAPNNFGGGIVTFTNNGNINNQALRDTSSMATLTATSFIGDTTNLSATVANVSSIAGLFVGQHLSGAGIPAGTTISSVGTTTITLSQAATATATGVTLTTTPTFAFVAPPNNTFLRIQFDDASIA